jgi:acyl carrier protein
MHTDAVYAKLTSIFHDVFDDEELVLEPGLTADDVPEWDSLSHVRLMLTVQQRFGIKFTAVQMTNLKDVGELVTLIQSKNPE